MLLTVIKIIGVRYIYDIDLDRTNCSISRQQVSEHTLIFLSNVQTFIALDLQRRN